MPRKPKWSYYPWTVRGGPPVEAPVALKCEKLIITRPAKSARVPKLQGMIQYADMSYLSCRILMISSTVVHPVALYMAGQTIEKYLKAVLLAQQKPMPRTHKLTELAGQAGVPFTSQEFVKLCQHLERFDIAGRYDDHALAGWIYSLDLLAFLDGFVVRCREIVQMPSDTPNRVANLQGQDSGDNPVMAAAVTALRDKNRHLDELVDPPHFRRVRD
jgi:hypothetical protein